MSKALVLKNVDFEANALTQVDIDESVPCTAISLSDSSKTTNLTTPFTLTATLTPQDTTDTLSWSSGDATVATVANGIVTPHKAGTVTISATCGAIVATCLVTISAYISTNLIQKYIIDIAGSESGNAAKISGGTSLNVGTSIITNGDGKYAYDPSTLMPSGERCYPIHLPDGCIGLTVTTPNQNVKISANWCSSTAANGYGDRIITSIDFVNPWDASIPKGNRTINVPSGSLPDCFFINCYLSGLTQEILDDITVEAIFAD